MLSLSRFYFASCKFWFGLAIAWKSFFTTAKKDDSSTSSWFCFVVFPTIFRTIFIMPLRLHHQPAHTTSWVLDLSHTGQFILETPAWSSSNPFFSQAWISSLWGSEFPSLNNSKLFPLFLSLWVSNYFL